MRVSTFMIFDGGSKQISRQQAEWMATQDQIATGRKVQRPSDDPVAASAALRVSQSKSLADQWLVNQASAREKLSLVETRLADAGSVLREAKTLLVQAGNGALSDADRSSLADTLEGFRTELLTVANARDGAEGYLFAGFRTNTQPFADSPGGVTYLGDHGKRTLEVAPGRNMEIADDGDTLFGRIRNGNGTFVTVAGGTNIGTGVMSGGTVYDPALLDTNTYSVTFNVAAGVTTYDVVNNTSGATVSTGNAWTSGQAIRVAGRQFEVSGAPSTGDVFSLAPSTQESVFDTLDAAITALRQPASTALGSTALRNALVTADAGLNVALDRFIDARGAAGTRLAELDGLTASASSESLLHAQRLSALQDLDYAEAISRFARQEMALSAAQQTYQRVSQLSLFDYL